MAVQTAYTDVVRPGQPGQIARPADGYSAEDGFAEVGTGERKPRPGDGVIWDSTNLRWKSPGTSDPTLRTTAGIVLLDLSQVATGATTQVVEYEDGDVMRVVTRGFVYVTIDTTAAIPYRTPLKWVRGSSITAESDWAPWTGDDATLGNTAAEIETYLSMQNPVLLWEKGGVPANTKMTAVVRLGYGRV